MHIKCHRYLNYMLALIGVRLEFCLLLSAVCMAASGERYENSYVKRVFVSEIGTLANMELNRVRNDLQQRPTYLLVGC